MKNRFLKFFTIRRFRDYALRTKLILAFLLVMFIPLAIIALINDRNMRSTFTDSANQELLSAAKITAAQLDTFITNNLETSRTASSIPYISNFISSPDRQNQRDEITLTLRAIARQNGYINSVAILNIRGEIVADTLTINIGLNESDHDYFKKAIEINWPFASDVEFSQINGTAWLYFSAPVHDTAGKKIGVIRTRYDALVLQNIILSANNLTGQGSFAQLVSGQNHIRLAHGTTSSIIFKSIVPLDAAIVNDLQAQLLLPPGTPEELSTNLPGFEVALENYKTQPFFLTKFETGENTLEQGAIVTMKTQDWHVIYSQSQDVFLAPINAQAQNNIKFALAIGVVVALFALFLSQTLTGPIVRLTKVAESISGGDIYAQAWVESKDEIGTLAGAFNHMTSQMRNFVVTLEQSVKDRTKALSSVAEVSTTASTILDVDKMLQTVVYLTQRRFGLYHAHVFTYDEVTDLLSIVACGWKEGDEHEGTHGTATIPIDQEQSLVARAARTRQPVIVNDVRSDPGWLPNPLLPDTASELAVPMLVGDKIVGVLDVQSDQLNAFTEQDANIQTTLAAQVAIAVQNARLYTQAEITRQEAQSLVDYAPEAIIVVDLETGLFTDPNENAEKLYGLSHDELVKVGPAQMSPPKQPDGRDSTEKAMEKINEAMQGKTPIFEWIHRNAQGQDIPCEVRLVRLPGAHPRVRASVTDITERKRLNEITIQHAKQQESLNLITQRIQSTITVESALQTAARELGHALGMKPTLVALDPAALAGKNKGN